MGLLDDAIREHLDLKRRRGADPAEVQRAEREALGPVRRAPEGSPGAQDADNLGESAYVEQEPVYEHEPAYEHEHEHEPAYEQEPATDEHAAWSHEPAPAAPAPPAPAPPAPEPFDHDELEHSPPAERYYEPPAEPDSAVPPPHPAGGDETAEYDVEEALGAEPMPPAPADDDVLEETPEFLQDTPDHDRLWFEQRPPKDFDFDG